MPEARNYQVSAKALRLAAAFTTKQAGRPALEGVCLRNDSVLGSDGHVGVTIKVAVEAPEGSPDVLIPTATAKVKTKAETVRVAVNGDYRLHADSTETVFEPHGDTFPNMSQVYPTGDPLVQINVQPILAARIFKALADYLGNRENGGNQESVTISIYSPEKPIRITAGHGDHVDALLMPCRRS